MARKSSHPASITPEFKIDPEFEKLIPPPTESEYASLKDSILKDGCREPLSIWKGENVILDGHNRYQICSELNVPFETVEIELSDRTAAKIWMIKNQRGRRNLGESQWAMLAVKLEALYAEQAKDRMGSRTDLGLNLGRGEFGRSAEKAARDMGVSHQTVTYAKTVSTKGIPRLAQLVESGKVAVSAAAKVTSLTAKSQEKIVERAEMLIKQGARPNVPALIREMASRIAQPDNPDELLEEFRKTQESSLKLLECIDETERPENLSEIRAISETIIAKIDELETNNLDVDIRSRAFCIIELKHFKTCIEGILPVAKTAYMKFERNGVTAITSSNNAEVEAFLPRSLFSHYAELGEIHLSDLEELHGMISVLSNREIPGKVNLLFFVKPGADDNPAQMHLISGPSEMVYPLKNVHAVECVSVPEPISTCEVRINGEDLAKAVRQSSALSKTGTLTSCGRKVLNFLVSKKSFRIVSEDENHDKGMAKPNCRVLGDGSANSIFDIPQLLSINPTIGKSGNVILHLGIDQPMTIDLAIDGMTIKYLIKEKKR